MAKKEKNVISVIIPAPKKVTCRDILDTSTSKRDQINVANATLSAQRQTRLTEEASRMGRTDAKMGAGIAPPPEKAPTQLLVSPGIAEKSAVSL